ncbi:sodium-dependent serotonin transporter-like isoform X2 [Dermatophagoides pteronyssinus]|uniref:sodium-dependent serotonin transporter-like isoform X2 n=1 Tax=Dermatophagoides pteronyssinus TaxID=6956 RepID=UPI003F67A6C8
MSTKLNVCKSISCTTELCVCPPPQPPPVIAIDKSIENMDKKIENCSDGGGGGSKMIISNSSSSLMKHHLSSSSSLSSKIPSKNPSHQQQQHLHQIWIENKNEREHWDKKIEFLLAVIGFAVDLGNVWRFPYICYRNGGGAFLIPYCIMLIFGGLPLFYLELALGQYYSSGCLTVWKHLCPIMKGLGYAICIIDIYMAMYYNTIIAWALYYFFISIGSLINLELPWQNCNNEWNTELCRTMQHRRLESTISTITLNNQTDLDNNLTLVSPAHEYFFNHVLHIDASTGIDSIGPIKPSLAICLMIVFLVVYFSLWKGVKSTGKAVWITALFPYFVIFVLLIRGTTLDGAADGIRFYLSPKWDRLYSINVWIDAATQIFFSLGPGFGTLMALASYNKFHNNCYRDAIITSSINCLTSFIAGFVTFSILGYMAKKLNKDIETVATDGPGLVFIVYPEAIATMYGSVFFSIIYFLMLITLGLDSTFGGLEAMITGLCDNYPQLLRKHREIFVAILIVFIYLCALPTTTFGGNYLITLLDTHGTALSVLFVVFIETMAISWFYGTDKISNQINEMIGHRPNIFWRVCWKCVCPIFLGFIAFASLINKEPLKLGDYIYPEWSVNVGWLITLSSLSCIPIYALYHLIIHKREKFWQNFIKSSATGQTTTTTAEMTNLNADDNDSGDLKNQRQLDDTIIMGDSV